MTDEIMEMEEETENFLADENDDKIDRDYDAYRDHLLELDVDAYNRG